ncbi:MAG: hypothetical protein AAFX55_01895 [Bacteroidota bacterium]
MEETIDIINAYLNKELTESEIFAFEQRLQTDSEFNNSFEEHVSILKGMGRIELVKEIDKARRAFIKSKWLKYVIITATVLFMALLIWLLVFKNENRAKNELEESLNFKTELTQSFKVSTDSIITITGEKGTQLTINPDDLEFDSGRDFKGKNLTIELMELTKKQDLLLANAQTISNRKWLISGGAFKIDIKSNTTSLRLKKAKLLVRYFLRTQKKKTC